MKEKYNIIYILCYLHTDQIKRKEPKPLGLGLKCPPRVAEKFLAQDVQKGARNLFANKQHFKVPEEL